MNILLELDPNVVKPGWTPLLITVGLALAMVLLFRSMRRQFRRVDANFPEPNLPAASQAGDSETLAAADPDRVRSAASPPSVAPADGNEETPGR
jgi:hypothetical protein